MRRLAIALLALAAVPVFALPANSLAKGAPHEPMGARIQTDTRHVQAGRAVDLTFRILGAPAALRLRDPAVWIEDSQLSPATFFAAHPTGVPGQYRARVTFPAAGRWTYTVGEREGRFFDFPVTVAAAKKSERSALLGATPLAALGLVGALGLAALVRRRRTAG
jgi:hypothetical protein